MGHLLVVPVFLVCTLRMVSPHPPKMDKFVPKRELSVAKENFKLEYWLGAQIIIN